MTAPSAPAPSSTDVATSPAQSFEQALEALEGVVARMERGDLPLEDALKAFEAGESLVRRCRELLDTAEQRVEKLLAEGGSAGDGGN